MNTEQTVKNIFTYVIILNYINDTRLIMFVPSKQKMNKQKLSFVCQKQNWRSWPNASFIKSSHENKIEYKTMHDMGFHS